MTITFFGVAVNPTDNGTNTTDPVAITPPASMQAGDLVVVMNHSRTSSGTLSINNNGGQSWTSLTQNNNSFCRRRFYWCIFNGTWSANPSFNTGTTCSSAYMLVFRSTVGGFVADQSIANATISAPGSPYTISITGITTTGSAVAIANWAVPAANTFSSLSGSGWSQTGLTAQYRNTSGSDHSASFAYYIGTGATGNVSQNESAGTAGATSILSFREIDLSVTKTESVTLGETKSQDVPITSSKTEDVTVADNPAYYSDLVSLNDYASLVVQEAFSGLTINKSEGVTLGDTVATTPTSDPQVNVTQAVTSGEAVTASPDTSQVNKTDGATIADTISVDRLLLDLSQQQAVTVAETIAQSIDNPGISCTDNTGVSDQVASSLALGTLSVSDGATLGETRSTDIGTLTVSISDGTTVADVPILLSQDPTTSKTDGVTVSDLTPGILVNLADLQFSDGTALGDSTSASEGIPDILATQAVSLGETAQVGVLALVVDKSESITTGDSISVNPLVAVLTITDGLTTADTVAVQALELSINSMDGISVADVFTLQGSTPTINAVENITVGESTVQLLSTATIGVVDSITAIGEVYSALLNDLSVQATDAVSLGTSEVKELETWVMPLEALVVDEAYSLVLSGLTLSVEDALTLNEADTEIISSSAPFALMPVDGTNLSDGSVVSLTDEEIIVSDSLSVDGYVGTDQSIQIDVSESITLGAAPEILFTLWEVNKTDTVSISDVKSVSLGIPDVINPTDAITVEEIRDIQLASSNIAIVDGTTISEASSILAEGLQVSATDNLTVGDQKVISFADLTVASVEDVALSEIYGEDRVSGDEFDYPWEGSAGPNWYDLWGHVEVSIGAEALQSQSLQYDNVLAVWDGAPIADRPYWVELQLKADNDIGADVGLVYQTYRYHNDYPQLLNSHVLLLTANGDGTWSPSWNVFQGDSGEFAKFTYVPANSFDHQYFPYGTTFRVEINMQDILTIWADGEIIYQGPSYEEGFHAEVSYKRYKGGVYLKDRNYSRADGFHAWPSYDFVVAKTEDLTVDSNVSFDIQRNLSKTESITVGESVELQFSSLQIVAVDELILNDNLSVFLQDPYISLTDSNNLQDLVSLELAESVDIVDSVTLSEIIVAISEDLQITVIDSLTVNDTRSVSSGAPGDFNSVHSDNITISDVPDLVLTGGMEVVIAEAETVAEITATQISDLATGHIDTVAIEESVSLSSSTMVSAVDDDLILADLSQTYVEIDCTAQDNINVVDEATILLQSTEDQAINVFDNLVIGDISSQVSSLANILASDDIPVSDNVSLDGVPNILLSEGIVLSDTPSVIVEVPGVFQLFVLDGISINEVVNLQAEIPDIARIDTIAIGDIVQSQIDNLFIGSVENVVSDESITPALSPSTLTVEDSLVVSDQVNVSLSSVSDFSIDVVDSQTVGESLQVISGTLSVSRSDPAEINENIFVVIPAISATIIDGTILQETSNVEPLQIGAQIAQPVILGETSLEQISGSQIDKSDASTVNENVIVNLTTASVIQINLVDEIGCSETCSLITDLFGVQVEDFSVAGEQIEVLFLGSEAISIRHTDGLSVGEAIDISNSVLEILKIDHLIPGEVIRVKIKRKSLLPRDRTYDIPEEDRAVIILAEHRSFIIDLDDREFEIISESREYSIDPENREVDIHDEKRIDGYYR
jgi:hypothetical protein